MNSEQSELTLNQAHERARAGLAERWPTAPLEISEEKTLTCGFGWVFTLDVTGIGTVSDRTGSYPLPTLVLVDKRSGQVIATSKAGPPMWFAGVFENLSSIRRLNGRNWCLTMTAHVEDRLTRSRGIAETARSERLEDISPRRA